MNIRHVSNEIAIGPNGQVAWQFRAAFVLALVLLATCMFLMFESARASSTIDSDMFTISSTDHVLFLLRFGIAAGLVACALGLHSRSASGLYCSVLGTIWMMFVYVAWQRHSVAFLRNLETPDFGKFGKPGIIHAGGLRGATWLDLLVLIGAAVLLIWQAITIVNAVMSSSKRANPVGLGRNY